MRIVVLALRPGLTCCQRCCCGSACGVPRKPGRFAAATAITLPRLEVPPVLLLLLLYICRQVEVMVVLCRFLPAVVEMVLWSRGLRRFSWPW